MQTAAHTLFDWWHHVAAMQDKYGLRHDIETKPEWPEMRRLQDRMLREMHEQTRVPVPLIFEALQLALPKVMGDLPTRLTHEEAEAVVAETSRTALRRHLLALRLRGMRN